MKNETSLIYRDEEWFPSKMCFVFYVYIKFSQLQGHETAYREETKNSKSYILMIDLINNIINQWNMFDIYKQREIYGGKLGYFWYTLNDEQFST